MAEFTSNLGAFLGATERQMQAGLIAAAELFLADIKDELKGGYTSGDFVTGANVNAVRRGSPEQGIDGWQIAVGSDVDYALYWEVGHHNLFTRKYERVEKWVPTMLQNREKYVAAVADEIKAVDGAL